MCTRESKTFFSTRASSAPEAIRRRSLLRLCCAVRFAYTYAGVIFELARRRHAAASATGAHECRKKSAREKGRSIVTFFP